MAGIHLFFTSPAPNATIGRRQVVTGGITAFNGSIFGVSIQFGVGGPRVNITPANKKANQGITWRWEGLVPNNVRPGQAFPVIVSASGTMITGTGPDGQETQSVDDERPLNVVLENVVPELTVEAFQSPMVVTDPPYALTLRGTVREGSGPPYGVPRVQLQVGDGPPTDLPVANGTWSVPLSLPPGDHPLTVQASDPFASVTSWRKTLTVLRFPMPAGGDPALPRTLAGVPTTSSVTSWTRLEPQVTDADLAATANARLYDPLWQLTRQWQLGEFQGEDAGSPVQARLRAAAAALSRCHLGPLSADVAGQPYDPGRVPLEALVERRPMRPAGEHDPRLLSLAVDAGLQLLRMLELDPAARAYRPAFLARYAMAPPPADALLEGDDAGVAFVQTMAGRAPDGRRLAAACRDLAAGGALDPALGVAPADAAAVRRVAAAWLAWYDGLFSEPAGPAEDAWTPDRLEYAVSVAARLSAAPQDALTFTATEFGGGRLDWSGFDLDGEFGLDPGGEDHLTALVETTVPAPVTFRGAPAARFWELEDAVVAYGLVPVGPTDLAHLLMIEYASSYGNDWYLVPLELPVGSVTRVGSLVVTDTFGVRSLLRPIGDPALPAPYFSMWQPAARRRPGDPAGAPVPNLFLLPPTIGRGVDGAPVEDVLFLRDEMANLAWAVERSVEGATGAPVGLADGAPAGDGPAPPAEPGAAPRWLLATPVPGNWVPLLPVQLDDHGRLVTRLKRGAVLQPDGTGRVRHGRSQVLAALAGAPLFDEEIPREGAQLTRRRRMARWVDGSTWAWTALRNQVGRGEGSAGLRFDRLEGDGRP
jgi:hypothetical protein